MKIEFLAVAEAEYGVIYQVRPDKILIVAMHLHRDPGIWKLRIKNS